MKSLLALFCVLLPLFAALFATRVHATDITVSCTGPTKYTDGTAITSPVKFNLYGAPQGQPKKLLAPSPLATCNSVRSNVNAGTQCYQMTAVVAGSESVPTAESCLTVAATPPPTCPPQPVPETRPQACAAPLIGSWSQSRSYSSVAAPACWQAGAWLPTDAPAGVCASLPPPTLTTADTRAYEQRSATLPLALIGVTRIGQPCGPETLVRNGVTYCRVALWSATGVPQVLPVVWMQNLAGTDYWVKASQ